jgi:Protein of unknown function (DUF3225)
MSATPDVNNPKALAELTAAFEAYERALVGNDIAALNRMFWDSPLTLRYGTREHELLRSHADIAEFRRKRGAIDQRRTLRNTRIVTLGNDFGVANTEYIPAGSDKIGRQSQTWMRTADGWKIVCAHVSFGV